MRLIEILNQSRRDFKGKYKCEFCSNIDIDKSMSSYDDDYYHQEVIPNQKCTKCKKSTFSEGKLPEKTKTKYPEGLQL